MEKKVMNQPQSEKAIQNNKGFSAFDTHDNIKYWINYVKCNSTLLRNTKISEDLSIMCDILNRLTDKIKELEDKQQLINNNHITVDYGTTK